MGVLGSLLHPSPTHSRPTTTVVLLSVYAAMAPCTTTGTSLMTVAFALTGGRPGDSFIIQSTPGHGWMTRPRTGPAADQNQQRCCVAAAGTRLLSQSSSANNGDGNGDENREKADHVRGRNKPGDGGGEDIGGGQRTSLPNDNAAEAEERLRREVFANEKGFLDSAMFNPAKAREKEAQEEASRLASEWGSTPERAREVMQKTQGEDDLNFQDLERIAQELNMSDKQQRAFMMKASMKKLTKATTLPRREPRNPVKEAVKERVFQSEKGFLQNSKEFKSRLKSGSGVRFDAQGFPVLDDSDPVVAVARSTQPSEKPNIEGVVFPALPDCPRCSTPSIEAELEKFGMCLQCKGQELFRNAYSGPAAASKYTYDNGEAPFSNSWNTPSRPTQPLKQARPRSDQPTTAETASPSSGRSPNANVDSSSNGRRVGSERPAADAPSIRASMTATGLPVGDATGVGRRVVSGRPATPTSHEGPPLIPETKRRLAGEPGAEASRMETYATAAASTRDTSSPALEARNGGAAGNAVATTRDGKRDAALRKLGRDVAELRRALSRDDGGGGGGEEGESDAVRRLTRHVAELRSQLSDARKEQAMTRSALRRLQDQVDGLAGRGPRR